MKCVIKLQLIYVRSASWPPIQLGSKLLSFSDQLMTLSFDAPAFCLIQFFLKIQSDAIILGQNYDLYFIFERKFNWKEKSFNIADGGRSEWIGDGFCDDMNNQKLCDFDSGDCCGAFTKIHFCMECRCIRK